MARARVDTRAALSEQSSSSATPAASAGHRGGVVDGFEARRRAGRRSRSSSPRRDDAGGGRDWPSVTLGDGAVTFGSPDDAMRFFNRLLETSPVDEDWPVAGETHAVLLDALGRHPDARDKMGDGVATFRVSLHPTAGTAPSWRRAWTEPPSTSASASASTSRSAWTRKEEGEIPSALTARIARAESVAACLDLVARHVDEFDRIHVAAAMHRLARLAQRDNNSSAGVVPRVRFGDDKRWRDVVKVARDMCDAGELDARAHASVVHSVAAAVDAGAVEMTSTGVYDLLTSLERKTPDALEKHSTGVEVANLLWGFAKIGWQPSRATWEATERSVVWAARAGELNAVETSNVAWACATLGWELTDDAWRALDLSAATARER